MCDKCKPHAKYWLHIADDWTKEERKEMLKYLFEQEIVETSNVQD